MPAPTSPQLPLAPSRSSPRQARRQRPSQEDAFFRHMVENMRNGVLAFDRSGAIVLINGEACRIFGLEECTSYVGRRYTHLLRELPEMVRVLSGAFELDALPNRAELRLAVTGTVIGYTLSLVRDGEQQVIGAALFFKDLTYVEQMAERERLRDRLAALGEMAATVAHEIKNRFGGIILATGHLRRQLADHPDALAQVSEIANETKEANGIVQEILEFVRPVRLQMEPTSLRAAVQNAVAVADGKVARGATAVSVEIPPDLPGLKGDGSQLTQVFANLLINAYQALQGSGTVWVRAWLASDANGGALLPDGVDAVPTIVVEVEDDGPGVPAELTEKIFNPFITTKAQGSGLGLAIVRKIVDAHEGRIDMTSAAGRGTCFRVTLPVEGEGQFSMFRSQIAD